MFAQIKNVVATAYQLMRICLGSGWFAFLILSGLYWYHVNELSSIIQELSTETTILFEKQLKQTEMLLAEKTKLQKRERALIEANPDIMEALYLWSAMPGFCAQLPLGVFIQTGDQGCTKALGAMQNEKAFPDHELTLNIINDTSTAITLAKQFFLDRCHHLPSDANIPEGICHTE